MNRSMVLALVTGGTLVMGCGTDGGREDGIGLGLTLAQTFVQQHDGLIEVESRPGHTEFQILLPLVN